jgi:hypothetical protein
VEAKALRVSAAMIRSTFGVFRRCGQARAECVVYWTAPAELSDLVDGIDHPAHRQSAGGYEIESSWLTEYWFRLAHERRAIRAQIHTHPGPAFHSSTDDHWPVISQPGFISIVIPDFAMGSVSLDEAWIGHVAADGRWRQIPVQRVVKLTP